MTDCEVLGHPNVDGRGCPCGVFVVAPARVPPTVVESVMVTPPAAPIPAPRPDRHMVRHHYTALGKRWR